MDKKQVFFSKYIIVTAGSTYMDIDAYACSIALAELLQMQGLNAIAYSNAPCNYSVVKSLVEEGQLHNCLPTGVDSESLEYIIVDVSDPEYIKNAVPLNRIVAVYDHHTGFESYWENRIGARAHIEFIGAAATLIFCEWKAAGLLNKMKRSTTLLLIAAILDNTLNLLSENTTEEDVQAFHELCMKENIDEKWCASYFAEVQKSVEADMKNALFNDIKHFSNNKLLPSHIAQICIWDSKSVFEKLSEIRALLSELDNWMINLIDIKNRCSYFVCDNDFYQNKIEKIFGVDFDAGVAKSPVLYLRKEIIKKIQEYR